MTDRAGRQAHAGCEAPTARRAAVAPMEDETMTTMRYHVLTLRRADLVAAGACSKWLAIYDDICRLRGDDAAPWVRRGGVSRRDPTRLRVELTPLAQVWLARDGRGALEWLREHGLMGAPSLARADLRGADLSGAYLRGACLSGAYLRGACLSGAYLRGACLSGADLRGADLSGACLIGADLYGADLSGAYLSGAYLSGAYLRGACLSVADLSGAYRCTGDASVPGWTLRDGQLVREVA